MSRRFALFAALSTLWLVPGCLINTTVAPSGADGGSRVDAGATAIDGGVTLDAGSVGDAGTQGDAGTTSDAGVAPDAGVVADAGLVGDAGVADAGPAADAGTLADGGSTMEMDAGIAADAGIATDAGVASDAGVAADAGVSVSCEGRYSSDGGTDADGGAYAHLIGTVYDVTDGGEVSVPGTTLRILGECAPAPLVTNSEGGYGVYAPVGARVVYRAEPPGTTHTPMLRGRVSRVHDRPRNFKLRTWTEADAIVRAVTGTSMGVDRTKGIVRVVFRNANGSHSYCVTLRDAAGATVGSTGAIYMQSDVPALSSMTCIPAGASHTLDILGVPAGDVTFEATTAAPAGCMRCDAQPLPVEPGVITMFEFECGVRDPNDMCQ
jgi:hypothetical protein